MKQLIIAIGMLCLLTPRAAGDGQEKALQPGRDFIWVVRDGGGGAYEAFPDIVRMPNGHLMVVFYEGYSHVSTPNEVHPKGGRVSFVISKDEGRTWSDALIAADTPEDDRDPSITALSDGRLLCTYFEYPSGDVYAVYSSTNGETWTEPQKVCDRYGVSSPAIELESGRIVIPAYRSVALSDDSGETWNHMEIPSATQEASGHSMTETAVIERPDGQLLAIHRVDGGTPMYQTVSDDGGETWSESTPLPYPGHSPYLMYTPDGALILSYRAVIGEEQAYETRMCISRDDGSTWGEEWLIDNVIGAYPSMVPLRDGSILVVYYEEGIESSIRARRFRLVEDHVEWLPWSR